METNKVVLDINDYNMLYSKTVKCEQLEEENELLRMQLDDAKRELINVDAIKASDDFLSKLFNNKVTIHEEITNTDLLLKINKALLEKGLVVIFDEGYNDYCIKKFLS